MAGTVDIRVPDMGDFKNVAVIDVLVKPGDAVEVDTPLITLETDKATMDVPATAAGIVEKVHTAKGGKISPGDLVVTLRSAGAAPQPKPVKSESPPPARQAPKPEPAIPPEPAPRQHEPAKPVATQKTATSVEVRVPDMGGFKDVAVIDVLVKPGQTVEIDTPLVTLETDKATMDVPSTATGVVEKVHIAKDGKVSTGDLIVTVRGEGGGYGRTGNGTCSISTWTCTGTTRNR